MPVIDVSLLIDKSDNDLKSIKSKWNMSLPSDFAGSCLGLKPRNYKIE
jgi:hypothetical protein